MQSSGNRNVVGLMSHFLFPFGAMQQDNKDCLLCHNINFPIKTIDSHWMLKRGQHELYWKTC